MSSAHYCLWHPPVTHPERFALWSANVQKLLEYLPQYVAAGRKQRYKILSQEDLRHVQVGQSLALGKLEEYDERRHGEKSQYLLISPDPGGTTPIFITGPDGEGKPIITGTVVAFSAERRDEECYPPFSLSQEELVHGAEQTRQGFLSWKTPYSPHDLLVTAALVRLASYFPELQIRSDMGAEGMWEGVELCKAVFGSGHNPIQEKEAREE